MTYSKILPLLSFRREGGRGDEYMLRKMNIYIAGMKIVLSSSCSFIN